MGIFSLVWKIGKPYYLFFVSIHLIFIEYLLYLRPEVGSGVIHVYHFSLHMLVVAQVFGCKQQK